MTVKLTGSSSGHVNLTAKAAAASNTLTLPDTASGELVAADSSGNINLADNKEIKLGNSGDLSIKHDGSNSYIKDSGTGNLVLQGDNLILENAAGANYLVGISGGETILYHNDTQKFQTQSAGCEFNGILKNENDGEAHRISLGAANDFNFFHDGTNSRIVNNTGSIQYRSASHVFTDEGNNENHAKFIDNGQFELFHDNTKALWSDSQGVHTFGNIQFSNDAFGGDKADGKICTHGNQMYIQNAGNSASWIFRLPNGTEPANIGNGGAYSGSDERRKKDITTISNALSIVKQLTGRSFTWKADDKKSFGVIAQEIEPVLPDIVCTQSVPEGITDPDPYKMVNYAALTGHFIEAIKELSAEVETLKTKVAALEGS